MNIEKFLQLIDSPATIGKPEMEDLEGLSSRYPWFFSSRQLQLYFHKNQNNIHFNDYLSKWSFRCPSPEKLFTFLNLEEAEAKAMEEDVVPETAAAAETKAEAKEKEVVPETAAAAEVKAEEVVPETAAAVEIKAEAEAEAKEEEVVPETAAAAEIKAEAKAEAEEVVPETAAATAAVAEIKAEAKAEAEEVVPETAADLNADYKIQSESLADIIMRRCQDIKNHKHLKDNIEKTEVKPAEVKAEAKEETKEVEPESTAATAVTDAGLVKEEVKVTAPEIIVTKPVATEAYIEPEFSEKTKAKEPEKVITPEPVIKEKKYYDNSDIVRNEGESIADFVIRRCQEIKKRRQGETIADKREENPAEIKAEAKAKAEEVVTGTAAATAAAAEIKAEAKAEAEEVVPEAAAATAAAAEIKAEEVITEKNENLIPDFSITDTAFITDPKPVEAPSTEQEDELLPEEEGQSAPLSENRMSSIFSDFTFEEETISIEKTKIPEIGIESEQSAEEISVPFDLPVAAYDISELEKAAEVVDKDDYTGKKMDFINWLTVIEKDPPKKHKRKAKNFDLIDRFIKEQPRIVIKHESGIQSEVTASYNNDNESPDICSETLADILVAQDKPDEAIKMYKKLCLLYPEKSVYFAARIEKIQKNEI